MRYIFKLISFIIVLFVIACSQGDEDAKPLKQIDFDIVKQYQNDDGSIKAFVSYQREEFSIAEKLQINLEIHKTGDAIVIFPKEEDFRLDKLSISRIGSLDRETADGADILKRRITLLPEEMGNASIDSIRIRYTLGDEDQVLETDPISFTIVSFTGKPSESVMFEDKLQPESLQLDYSGLWLVLIIFGIVIVVGVCVFLLVVYLKRRSLSETPEEVIPAHINALKKLDELEAEELAEKGEIGEFHRRLSLILREYIENRFDIRAPEQTTEEFMLEMSTTRKISDEHKALLKDYLTQCDLIKFAKFRPPIDYHKEAMNRARTFIETTAEEESIEDRADEVEIGKTEYEEKEVRKA
jgi:hypothetical protein